MYGLSVVFSRHPELRISDWVPWLYGDIPVRSPSLHSPVPIHYTTIPTRQRQKSLKLYTTSSYYPLMEHKPSTTSRQTTLDSLGCLDRFLSPTSVTRALIIIDPQSMFQKVQDGWLWYEWLPIITSSNMREVAWIY